MIENRREIQLKEICLFYLQYYKSLIHIKEAVITTAIPLSSKYRDSIFEFFTRKFKMKIELKEKVDPSIIGGFIFGLKTSRLMQALLPS